MVFATQEQIREIERRAINGGLSEGRLMENAGAAAAKHIRDIAGEPKNTVVLCGNGNNGGDGFVIARKLAENGYTVAVVLTDGMPRTASSREAFSKLSDMTIVSLEAEPYRAASVVTQADLVVDAVYGIGFHGGLPQVVCSLFAQVHSKALRIAIDMPSGLECDSGVADPCAFRATHTVTFIARKPALVRAENADLYGDVRVADIGISDDDISAVLEQNIIQAADVASCFQKRDADSHKGTFGHLLAVCGSVGMAGAAILSARAALRSGVGLLTVAMPRSIYPIVSAAVPEVLCLPLPENTDGTLADDALRPLLQALRGKSAVLIGCGLGCTPSVERIVRELILRAQIPVVLDADGLNVLAKHIDVLETETAPLILTPHPGEMARLIGATVGRVQEQRLQTATAFSAQHKVVLALKGHRTVVADEERYYINPTGNPGMATGGSGDVLAGMIAAFVTQGFTPLSAAMCGVYLHGKAGDVAAALCSQHAMLPSDMIDALKGLFLDLE